MSKIDLLQMSLTNLLRRKLRTLLTVFGVVVGSASIVVMLSLGLGLKKTSMEQIEKSGGLTTVTVYPNDNQVAVAVVSNEWQGSAAESGSRKSIQRIDDKVAEKVAQIPHVKVVSPVLEISVLAKTGIYQSYLSIRGMTAQALQNMNLKIGKGSLPTEKAPLALFFGNQVVSNFYNEKGAGEAPNFDPMKEQIFYIFDTEAYELSRNRTNQAAGEGALQQEKVKPPKKYLLNVCGVLAGTAEEYTNGSYDVYADLDALKEHVRKAFKKKAIPGQPTGKKGKPLKEIYYNSLYVSVDGMDNVEEVQKAIQDMGLQATSNIEWLRQMQKQMGTIQAVLGGIGSVALFVAAIGIANTMIMSIYERTKEIGILKVLGCGLPDIGKMFLIEAGAIGFAGGVAGLSLSYGISAVVNFLAKNASNGNISYIPVWLAGLALLFSVLIGMAAGVLPAFRAMRLSPLAALRNE